MPDAYSRYYRYSKIEIDKNKENIAKASLGIRPLGGNIEAQLYKLQFVL